MNKAAQPLNPSRIDWVDYAKGICIILVVMMHSTLGVEKALGEASWMNSVIAWAAPFRMPDFFLISGLFLASRIDRPWKSYLDTKVVHFAYFYVLWLTIQFVLKSPGFVADMGTLETVKYYFWSFVEPMGTLWFIHMLAVFFVIAKVLEPLLPKLTVWLMAAFFHSMHVKTGFLPVDEFTSRFVFFYSGYVAAPYVFRFAEGVARRSMLTLVCGLYIWATLNGWFVFNDLATLPGVSLFLGMAGVAAIVAVSQILVQTDLMRFVRYCGQNSIVIYLAFFVFMAATRIVLIKTGIIADGGVMSLIVTAAGVIGPVILHFIVRRTPARFLFERPALFRIKHQPQAAAVAA